ncbi:efflux RND transporter periplasmic adaptor subunit [Bosea sp. SSUT16]|jgi:multidrug efflux system membrane fusion protein|uniref:Efflux RND transporter periplasmic adaptor subunit n=1 Tax=Bosea spartocytisi TaxID=2773451 RepID=A0A927E5H9_9HYPH|nr:efflux RND transporter periplasmic adaptor subunit [Bosea spartocytisi]MBD3844748.1 efflux RND transporter periplasmic adaptor subunit [Bosea spartocytisi]MCT4470950.1 efflux RND transporter periplasmic adaptor subunit [Bosea spartocytisi]
MKRSGFLVGFVLVAAVAAGVWYTRLQGEKAPQAAGAGRGAPAVSVVSAVAEQADFPIRKHAIGFVETPASVTVKSRIDSQIVAQHVTDGQFVKAGDLLFTLDDRDIKAQIAKDEAMLLRDEATHTRNVADLERYKQLFARNAGTQQQVDLGTADEKSSAANIQADHATLDADRLKLSYTRILAPIDGRVGAVMVTPGNLVSANSNNSSTGLLTITQMKPLRVSFALPESELPTLHAALLAPDSAVVTAKIPQAGDQPAVGKLNFVDSNVDITSGTITAKAAFANDDLRLWPGQYVDVEFIPDTLKGVTVIPTVAVQTGQKGPYVFVAKANSTVDLRQIKVALSDGGKTAVTEGLAPGERVVVDGQMRLKQGTAVRERGASGEKAPVSTPVAQEGHS